jgi:hypothetical protein
MKKTGKTCFHHCVYGMKYLMSRQRLGDAGLQKSEAIKMVTKIIRENQTK